MTLWMNRRCYEVVPRCKQGRYEVYMNDPFRLWLLRLSGIRLSLYGSIRHYEWSTEVMIVETEFVPRCKQWRLNDPSRLWLLRLSWWLIITVMIQLTRIVVQQDINIEWHYDYEPFVVAAMHAIRHFTNTNFCQFQAFVGAK